MPRRIPRMEVPVTIAAMPEHLVNRALRQYPSLTRRQMQVLKLIMTGLTNSKIGDELDLGIGAIEKHFHNILIVMGISHIIGNNPRVILVNKMWLASRESV